MVTPHDQQWLDNEEILEKSVLGRLSDNERARLDDLLKSNPELKMAVELEAMIIAGIRRLGREDMKRRLRDAVNESKVIGFSPGIMRILKIAATVAVLTGGSIAAYYLLRTPAIPPVAKEEATRKEQEEVKAPTKLESTPERTVQGKEEKEALAQKGRSEKKSLVVVPPKPPMKKSRESATMPPPAVLNVELVDQQTLRSAQIIFKSPSDLAGINQAFGEANGMLEWFFVDYTDGRLQVYLDATRFSSTFSSASLKIDGAVMWITMGKTKFKVSLDDPTRVRKAVLD